VPVDAARQLRGTVVAAGRGDCLYQARQARTRYIDWGLGTRSPGPLVGAAAVSKIRAIRVHVARLSVLSIAVHGELGTPKNRRATKSQTQEAPGLSRITDRSPRQRCSS